MNSRIRVLQMVYTFDIEVGGGGLTRFATELAKHLNHDLFEVVICSLGFYNSPSNQRMIKKLNQSGIEAFNAAQWKNSQPLRSFYQSYLGIQKYLKSKPVDIIHSHSEFTDIIALFLKIQSKTASSQKPGARLPKSPKAFRLRKSLPRNIEKMPKTDKVLRTVHYSDRDEWIGKPLRRWLFTNFLIPFYYDLEIGINDRVTDRLTNRLISRIRGQESKKVYNAIDLSRFENIAPDAKRIRHEFNIPQQSQVFGTIGRLAKQKGYSYLLESAKLVFRKLPQSRLLIIGAGPLAGKLKSRAEELDIRDNVIFTGPRTDIMDLLACMDVFVSSSLWEGLPTVLLESMACGVPIVATNIPGTNELIEHNTNGILVPPKQADEMSSAILETIQNAEFRHMLSQNARHTLQDFRIQHIAKEYQTIYQSLI